MAKRNSTSGPPDSINDSMKEPDNAEIKIDQTDEDEATPDNRHNISPASSSQSTMAHQGIPSMAYRTPSAILTQLNIDKITHDVTHLPSISSSESDFFMESEKTLAIIKPDCVIYQKEIEKRIIDEGFCIMMKRKICLSPEQASEFYKKLYGTFSFPTLIVYMSSGPIIVYCLSRFKGIAHWRHVIGPRDVRDAIECYPSSLRAKYGARDNIENGLHGSDDLEAANNEIRFFFPKTILEPLAVEEACVEYLNSAVNDSLSRGLAELLKVRPVDPILWMADWLLWNNPNRPKMPEHIARTKT